jgi:hypothetical protein
MRVEQLDAHLSFRLTVIAGGGLLECGTPAQARWPVAALMCAAAARCG